jgi:hypothetical protein
VIGASIDKEWTTLVLRILPATIMILLVFLSRRIEALLHKYYMETWQVWKSRGKWQFILTNYVLIRGGIIFLAVSAPMLPMLILTAYTVGLIIVSFAALAALMIYLGYEEWNKCEEDYKIQMFRDAAEQARIAGN